MTVVSFLLQGDLHGEALEECGQPLHCDYFFEAQAKSSTPSDVPPVIPHLTTTSSPSSETTSTSWPLHRVKVSAAKLCGVCVCVRACALTLCVCVCVCGGGGGGGGGGCMVVFMSGIHTEHGAR